MDFIFSIITGIVSGVIASVVFYFMLKIIKPNVSVSDKICAELKDDGSVVYRVKVVNHSKFTLTKFNYFLQYKTLKGDKINTVVGIEAVKPKIGMIQKFSKKDVNYDYAVRLTYDIPLDRYQPKKESRLVFTFVAEHPHSNSSSCVTKIYSMDDVVFGTFEKGKSMEYTMQPNIKYSSFEEYCKDLKLVAVTL